MLDALEYELPGRAVTLGPVADIEQGLGLLLRELLLADSHERVDDDVRDSRVGLVLDGAATERLGEIFYLADGRDEALGGVFVERAEAPRVVADLALARPHVEVALHKRELRRREEFDVVVGEIREPRRVRDPALAKIRPPRIFERSEKMSHLLTQS